MSLAIDASVLVRLLVGQPKDQAKAAMAFVKTNAPVLCNDVAIAETWFALRNHYGFEPAQALEALRRAFDSGVLVCEPDSGLTLACAQISGSAGFVDRLLVGKNVSLGLVTHTFDHAQAKLRGAQKLIVR